MYLQAAEYDKASQRLGYGYNVRLSSISLSGTLEARYQARYPGQEAFLLSIQQIHSIYARSNVSSAGYQMFESKIFLKLPFEANTS